LCVRGRELLYRYCAARGIDHRRCGKLTVAAAPAQVTALEKIESNARASGVNDLEWWDRSRTRRAEPQLKCASALYSPSTGIIDSHGLMQSLLADAEAGGARVVYASQVCGMRPTPAGIEVAVNRQSTGAVRAQVVVNSAGLEAEQVARGIEGFDPEHIPPMKFAKGSYFALSGDSPFSHLIYPLPRESGHLGIHMTLDLAGTARFGPDMQWVDRVDYTVDPRRLAVFAEAIREYWPGLDAARLRPAYAGIRPKISGPGEATRDFCISAPSAHGVPGIVNLFGMESPGLTASLALGDYIAGLAD
jgi:L-2-hydroxyglutarate oxidase LhgO